MSKSFYFTIFYVFILSISSISCENTDIHIIKKDIVFDDLRTSLTKQYIKERYNFEAESITIDPRIIVVHWTATKTSEQAFNTFKSPSLQGSRNDISYASNLNVSAHFLVDRNGQVFQLMKDNIMARHVIGLNYSSIGIENVGGIEGYPLTNEQLISNVKLVKYLKSKYPKIDYLIGHFEYTNFENHELWLEKDSLYRTIKIDPGIEFMNKLRKDLNNLNFKELP
jgi:N-acetyl-anhydromuramyl-L-alanine amidase AmpD